MTKCETQVMFGLKRLKLSTFFLYGGIALLGPYLPLFYKALHFSSTQIGLLMSIGPMVSLAANPWWGYWGDRWQNLKKLMLVLLLGNLLISQIFFQMESYAFVLIALIFFYLFQTALNPMNTSLILQTIEDQGGQFGSFRLWGSLGFAVVAAAAGPVVESIGIKNIGYIYGSFIIVTIVLILILPKPNAEKAQRKGTVHYKDAAAVFADPRFIGFLFCCFLISVPNQINNMFISLYISDLGGSESAVGWSWFFAAILEVPIFILLDRYMRKRSEMIIALLMLSSLVYAVRWFVMSVIDAPYAIVVLQLVHAFSFGIFMYTGTLMCDMLVKSAYRSSAQAIYAVVWMGVSGILAGTVGGWMYDMVGPRTLFFIGGLMSLLALGGFAVMRKKTAAETNRQHLQA